MERDPVLQFVLEEIAEILAFRSDRSTCLKQTVECAADARLESKKVGIVPAVERPVFRVWVGNSLA
jgi:hypothetical protein